MKRGQALARVFRALSGDTQKEFGHRADIHPGLVMKYELGQVDPGPEHLDRLAKAAGLTVKAGEQILERADACRQPRLRAGQGVEEEDLAEALLALISSAHERLLALPVPVPTPRAADREQAGELWAILEKLGQAGAHVVVTESRRFQAWALAERICEESLLAAQEDAERAIFLAGLAGEIASRVQGPEGFPERLQGFAAAHEANALRAAGRLHPANARFAEARRLWDAGSDPDGLLDPGRLLELEASLRRDQRELEEALALLDDALGASRCPADALFAKAFTLEVMGEYQRAVDTLREARAAIEEPGDPRLETNLTLSLTANLCHIGRFEEAAEQVRQVRAQVVLTGSEINLLKTLWLEGRIAAGLGRRDEALRFLQQARQEFARRGMGYDVALALVEQASLLLKAGQADAVRELVQDLSGMFEAESLHREALAALRLFREAAEHRAATAELARRVLAYLFRARYDPELRYGA